MKEGSSVGLAVVVDEDNVPPRVVSTGESRKVSREGRKVKLSPTPARSRIEVVVRGSEKEISGEGEDLEVEENVEADRSVDAGGANEPGNEAEEAQGGPSKGDKKALKLRARAKKLAAESEERHRKRGVCYLSRVPPHLKPLKLRHMLEQFGVILRVYLAPEDAAVRMRRKRGGGNSGKNFTEGWVEFERKGVAKNVAAMLNGKQMGGKKRSAYHFDLWNIKYLSRFKWDNLTEEIAFRNAARDQKLAAEISAAKKERDFYLSKVDQSRAIAAMSERKRKRAGPESAEGKCVEGGEAAPASKGVLRRFKQTEVVGDTGGAESLPRSLPGKVFGGKGKK